MSQNASSATNSSATTSEPVIFQLSCQIEGIEPPVFRRIQVRDCNLAKLHEILQVVMGWQDRQLHYFDIEGKEYTADRKAISEFEWENSARITLSQLWKKGISEFSYVYDMSHNWVHAIVIEGPEEREPKTHYPCCVEAERVAPSERCSGPREYEQWLQAWGNPNHPQHKSVCAALGPTFEPEIRSLDPINEKLKRIRN
jgi:hypothetical protein